MKHLADLAPYIPFVLVVTGIVIFGLGVRWISGDIILKGTDTAKIENGMCPEPMCPGETYQVAEGPGSVLWRCPECKQTWLLVKVPDARPRD